MAITLADVARAAGVSIATASRALAGSERVAPERRERIQAAVARLGYVPDPAVRLLAARRWRSRRGPGAMGIAFVINDHACPPVLLPMRDGAAARAAELGYAFTDLPLGQVRSIPAAVENLEARGFRGLILGPAEGRHVTPALPYERFAAICCGSHDGQPPLPVVASDIVTAVRLAWAACRAQDLRRVGLIAFEDRLTGFNAWKLAAHLLEQSQEAEGLAPLFLAVEASTAQHIAAIASWREQFKPAVVLGDGDHLHPWLIRTGPCPFISLAAEDTSGRIAGLTEAKDLIGRTAVDQVDAALRDGRTGCPQPRTIHFIAPSWRDGASLPPITGSTSS